MISNEKLDKLAEEYTNGVRFFNLSTDCPPIEVLVNNAYKSGYRACEKDAEELVEALELIKKQIPNIRCTRITRGFFTEHDPLECSACIIFNSTQSALSNWRERGV